MASSKLDFIPPVIAHRGARNRAPENTMASFKAAYEDGAKWIETDVKLTSDGVPILMHDDTLNRTTNGQGCVADMDWDDMQNLDAGGWYSPAFRGTRVPTLAELLSFAYDTGLRLNLELKPCPGRAQATAMVALIEAAKLWPDTAPDPLISSFDVESLTIAAQLHPGWPRGLLLDEWRDDWREVVSLTQATTVNMNAAIVTPERIALLREAQKPILVYTVNDATQAKTLLQSGIQAVFSDNPGDIIKAL
ncbi:MAG: glycerophosphodiester phosphodiesterase [Alphaproteobacteria bacterium]